jgi:hypothetical protein
VVDDDNGDHKERKHNGLAECDPQLPSLTGDFFRSFVHPHVRLYTAMWFGRTVSWDTRSAVPREMAPITSLEAAP